MKTIRMEEMTYPDINDAVARGFRTAVVGVGATEQHGPHLPTMTDARIADDLGRRFALKMGLALQARTIAVGLSDHHLAFGGTISLKPETLRMIIVDYVESLSRGGFERIVFLPTHGGNFTTVRQAIDAAREKFPKVRVLGYTDLLGFSGFLNSLSAEFGIGEYESGAHAGENETSIMLALESDRVIREQFAPGYMGPTGEKEVKIILDQGMPALTKTGVLGDPRKASAAHGEIYLDRLAEFLIREIS